MTEIDAFSLLEQLASLTVINKDLREASEKLAGDEATLTRLAGVQSLTSIRNSLTDIGRAMGEASEKIKKHVAVVEEEHKALKVKLQSITVKEADLNEIKRRRKDESDGVKDRRSGAGMYTPKMAWSGSTSGTTS